MKSIIMIKQTILKQVTPGLLDLVIGNILKTTQIFIQTLHLSIMKKVQVFMLLMELILILPHLIHCMIAGKLFVRLML